MKGNIIPLKPGETFYLHREKLHYVGVVTSGDEPVFVFWSWNKWKKRRSYMAIPYWQFEIDWEYMRKSK